MQINLATGRIVIPSLVTVNASIRALGRHCRPRRANAIMRRYVTMCWHVPPKVPIPMGRSGTHPAHGSVDPHEKASQTASRSVQLFLHRCPTHRHADHAVCDICSSRPHHTHCMPAPSPDWNCQRGPSGGRGPYSLYPCHVRASMLPKKETKYSYNAFQITSQKSI